VITLYFTHFRQVFIII